MRPRKAAAGGRRTTASPDRDRPVDSPGFETVRRSASRRGSSRASASLLLDGPLVAAEEGLDYSPENPRSFPYSVKQQCWEKAEKVKGRDPDRWRRDALGNIVFRKLVGCPGCLCHDFDHIVPYSKATANRSKGNKMEVSKSELVQKSAYCRVSGRDMDLIELSACGNVRRAPDSGGCNIQ